MKKDSIGDPDIYLGGKLKPMTMPNGVVAWLISASKYVQEATKNIDVFLNEKFDGRKLAKRALSPLEKDYKPELDTTPELDGELANHFQSQIGILRWIVELGRVDIITEVSMLASHLALPQEGHIDAVFRTYAYLKLNHNARMTFDPTHSEINMSDFKKCD
jgi:hypothetical protein